MKEKLVQYSTNNSGGDWWLDEKQWKALEDSGWRTVASGQFVYEDGEHVYDSDGLPVKNDKELKDCMFKVPQYAFKRFNSIEEAIKEFEAVTGEDAAEEGCNCCGPPHSFSWEDGYVSGEECLEHLVGEDLSGLSKRELYARINSNN